MEGLVLRKIENMDKQLVTQVENSELLSPQRSITDFFKSPKRDLNNFFSSTPIEKINKKILETEIENSKVVEKKKKSKKSGRENNEIERESTADENVKNGNNVENEDDLNVSGVCKRSKKKKSKKKKDLDEDFIQHFDSIRVKSDTSTDDLNLSVKVKKKSKASLNKLNSVRKQTAEDISEEKTSIIPIVENSKPSHLEDKCEGKPKRKRQSDVGNTEQNSKRSKVTTEIKSNTAKSNKKEVENISYEDYLKGLTGDEEGGDIKDSQSQEPQDIELTPLPKNYPSITKFFEKKCPESNSKETSGLSCSPTPITITADIHPEPTTNTPVYQLFNKKNKSCKNQGKIRPSASPNSSCISLESEEIVLLGCEIQENDENISKTSPKSNDKSVAMKNDSSVEIIPSPKSAKTVSRESKAFLNSENILKAPSKTSQATLSFTRNGLKTDKNRKVEDISCIEAKKTEAEIDSLVECETDNKKVKKTKKVKKKKVTEENIEIEEKAEVNSEATLAENPRKSSRKKYQVTSLQFDDNQKTPIKMKIKCRRSLGNTSGEDTEFTPKSLKSTSSKKDGAKKLSRKLVKAQELLVKAKHHKTKKKSREEVTTKVSNKNKVLSNRLSPRLAAKPKVSMEEVIDVEEDDIEITSKNKNKPKTTKLKTNAKIESPLKSKLKKTTESPRKTPKKGSSNKLASIFTKKKSVETQPIQQRPPEDPEKVRLRQAFLSSGIPDEMKKQAITPTTVSLISDYPPFPTVSHVQQKEAVSMENCQKFNVKVRELSRFSTCDVTWKDLGLKKLYKAKKNKLKNNEIEKFSRHEWLNEETCKNILSDFQLYNTSYRFHEMFDSCKTKKLEELQSVAASEENGDKGLKIDAEGKNDTIVIDEPVVKKKKSKKKAKCVVEEKTNINQTKPEDLKIEELLWTERYQPSHSSEIIGNTSNINKLKTWLLEWKHKTHKDAHKMKKLLTKQSKSSKNSTGDNGWLKEDSDFYSEDSDEEEDRLCNTMLITGPHGIGKTATVYALAQELGYKVFEVNTSSSRNGKKILSRLQEATQSHQVAQNKDGIPPPVFSTTDNTPAVKKESVKNKLPTAFTNLFNKAKPSTDTGSKSDSSSEQKRKRKKGDNKNDTDNVQQETKKRKRDTQVEIDEKTSKKQKKKEKDDEDEHMKKMCQLYHKDDSEQAGGLNLTSTSVILFDEADLVFEKDVGFISAVQYFMNTTKIPIILTTTSRTLANNIQARLEVLRFDPPKSGMLVSHLQTLCLVEGVRTDRQDLHSLVTFYKNDVRKCMLALQFWVESGGGVKQKTQSLHKAPQVITDVSSMNSQSSWGTLDSDDDDFVAPRPLSHDSRRLEDENCNSSLISTDNLPVVHSLSVESVLSLTHTINSSLEDHISQFLQGEFKQGSFMSTVHCCDVLSTVRFNLLINNVIHLLPLPKTCHSKLKPVMNETTQRKQILTSEDYDSETSTNSIPSATSASKTETKRERRNMLKCLKSFSSFYDNVSLIDNIQTVSCLKDLDYPHSASASKREASVLDEISLHQHPYFDMLQQQKEILNHIETRSVYSLCEDIKSIQVSLAKKEHDEDFHEKLSLPVSNGITNFSAHERLKKSSLRIEDAQDNIWANLPLASTSRRHVKLDYLPYLRSIHQAESVKKVEKAKRRFHHHFDNIGFGLKKTTISYLEHVFE